MQRAFKLHWTDANAIAGLCVWLLLPLAAGKGLAFYASILWLVMMGPLTIAPLAFGISRIDQMPVFLKSMLGMLTFPAAVLLSVGICFSWGEIIALGDLALLWFVVSLLAAVCGLTRFISRATHVIEELCIDVGLLYLPVGAWWLYASLSKMEPLGFTEPIVSLTAAHFHFAGLAASVIAGMLGRSLWDKSTNRFSKGLHRICAFLTTVSPSIVALGIVFSPSIEAIASAVLAVSILGLAMLLLFVPRGRTTSKLLCVIAGSSVCISMLMAIVYALGEWLERPLVTIPQMVYFHGLFNVLGFALCGMLGLRLDDALSRIPQSRIPFSRLRGGWRIGSTFFDRKGAYDSEKQKPTGLLDSRSDLNKKGFAASQIDPQVADFYENTKDWQLHVIPQWRKGFVRLSRLYRFLSRSWEQLNLPVEPETEKEMRTELLPISDAVDGRDGVRAWVRTYRDSHEVAYAAAYSIHRSRGVPYMNIAFPAWGGQMSSILSVNHHHEIESGLTLTSVNQNDVFGEQGVYFVIGPISLRLPINESIEVIPTPAPPQFLVSKKPNAATNATVLARHKMWLFGVQFLVLNYWLTPNDLMIDQDDATAL